MNYENIYNSLIQKRQINKIDRSQCYCEYHHIKPRSIYPEFENEQSNIIALTAREHYIAHKLLVKIYEIKYTKDSKQYRCMINALWYISHTKQHKKYVTSKEYEKIRNDYSKMLSLSKSGKNHWHYGGKNSPETRAKISKANKGNTWTEERKIKFGKEHSGKNNSNYGHRWSDEARKKASLLRKGRIIISDEQRKLLSKKFSGKGNPMYGKSSWEKCTAKERLIRINKYKTSMKGKNKGRNCFTGKSEYEQQKIKDKMSFSQHDRWNHMTTDEYKTEKLKKKYAVAKSHLSKQLKKLYWYFIIANI